MSSGSNPWISSVAAAVGDQVELVIHLDGRCCRDRVALALQLRDFSADRAPSSSYQRYRAVSGLLQPLKAGLDSLLCRSRSSTAKKEAADGTGAAGAGAGRYVNLSPQRTEIQLSPGVR